MGATTATARPAALGPVACARELLEAVRMDEATAPYRERLAAMDDADLRPLRTDRGAAIATWANLYNAGTQLLLAEQPELYESPLRFRRFFGADCVTVGGTALGLDTIEHGLLRGGRSKYGLGYLPRVPRPGFERRYRLAEPDPRVHFVLNCGAASCPAIRSFRAADIDDQLDRASEGYLAGNVTYHPDREVAEVPRLFAWYHGDFGGTSGIHALLRRYEVIPRDSTPALEYEAWDWSQAAGKFAD